MEQQSLLAPVVAAPLLVLTDYGEVGGASHGHYVRIENGQEYLIKGPSFVPDHPTVAGNEWVAAQLASALGLPILDYRLVRMGEELFFASAYMQDRSFAGGVDATLFGRCVNKDQIAYGAVVFDAWLCNKDRHAENLVVRLPTKPGEHHVAILNDHSHLLVSPMEPRSPAGLKSRLDASPGPYVNLSFVRESIVSRARLGEFIAAAEAVSEATIRSAVQTAPEAILPAAFREPYERFLIDRRKRLRGAFDSHPEVFPNLDA